MHDAVKSRPESENFDKEIKYYYRYVESYDWTRAVDRFIGPETIFHRARSRETLKILQQLGHYGRCLDVGCGTAMITRYLAEGTVGIDINPRNLGKAMQYAPRARFVLCDAEGNIPFQANSFDVAVCTEMLEHLLYPQQALSEVHRVLRPKGILVGSVPGRGPIWKLRWISSSRQSFTGEPYHKHRRREEVETLLSQYFHIQKLYPKCFEMNWFFIAQKREHL